MKILLIHPPDSKVSIAPGRFEPLALEVLAACLPGQEVRIIDMRIENFRELDSQLSSFKPAVAGITVNNAIHVNSAKWVISHIAGRNSDVSIAVGGFHATMMSEDFRIPGVHAIFLGWAEKSFPAYITAMENGKSFDHIPGIEILKNGETQFRNKGSWDLKPSDIPFPRRDLIMKYYRRYKSDMGFRTALVNTTRGCPHRCSFCGVWQVSEGHFLLRKPEDVFKEIADLPDDVHRVFFADDNTFINVKNAGRLCELILDAKIRKKYSGYCRSDTINNHPELMRAWRKAGLDNLCVGFEATESNRLNDLNKRNSEESNAGAAGILNEIGIPFRPHFLIEPSFLKEDFRRIMDYVQKLKLKSPIFPILTPIPGTQYYSDVKEKIILDYDYFDFAHATMATRLSPKEFYQSWIDLYTRSYPVGKNLKLYILNKLSKIAGDKNGRTKYAYLNPVNLFMLRLFGLFLWLKIIRHRQSLARV